MKKIIGLISIALLMTFGAEAQSTSKIALGLRLGDNGGFWGDTLSKILTEKQ